MRRLFPLTALLLLACQALSPARFPFLAEPTGTFTASPSPTASATPTLTPTPSPTASPSPTPVTTPEGYEVRLHPEDGLYVGDLVSFEVLAPEGSGPPSGDVEVQVNPPDGPTFGPQAMGYFGIGGRPQATLRWVWDTKVWEAGDYEILFRVLPNGPTWTQTLTLSPAEALPAYAQDGRWESALTQCCQIYYVTGTAAERDLNDILSITQAQADSAATQLGAELAEPLVVVLMPRVLGHGGFASDEVYVSYLDRNYAGDDLAQVLHHELVHRIDAQLGGEFRPSMFVEGLAVYLSGGHYRQEPLFERAAALPGLGWYIPIPELADDFYSHQHEASYLEAGALIEYMVDRWGWDAFDAFYRSIAPPDSGTIPGSISQALSAHFGLTLTQLDTQFREALTAQPPKPEYKTDVQLVVAYYDTLRRYQLTYDPSAYFLTAWLLYIDELLQYNVVADYLRHPSAPENIAFETLLITVDHDLRASDYPGAQRAIDAVNAVLDWAEAGYNEPFYADPLAADYYAIANLLLDLGYQPQQITLNENSALVLAIASGTELIQLQLSYANGAWSLN